MKYIVLGILVSRLYLVDAQSAAYDSINFYDLDSFTIKVEYASDGALESQVFKSKTSNLSKIHYYNSKRRIARELIFEGKLMAETSFSYLEKGQVIKRLDVLNKIELPPKLNVYFDYPPLAREYEIEGDVSVDFILDDQCIPTSFRVLTTLGHGIDEKVRDKLQLMIQLSKKYHIPHEDCANERKPYIIWFSLNE